MRLTRVLFSALICLAALHAQAQTYSNTPTGTVGPFGETTNFGQSFTITSDKILESWSFFASQGVSGNYKFIVSRWDGAKAIGPAIYQQAGSYTAPVQELSTGGPIGQSLSPGGYIAILSTYQLATPVSAANLSTSNDDGGLTGKGWYADGDPFAPLVSPNWFDVPGSPGTSLAFVAVFTPVPEPSASALFALASAVALGLRRVRRSRR